MFVIYRQQRRAAGIDRVHYFDRVRARDGYTLSGYAGRVRVQKILG